MTVQQPNSFRTGPDDNGHFGIYGGRFVAETLMPLILLPHLSPVGRGRRVAPGEGVQSQIGNSVPPHPNPLPTGER